MSIIGTAFRRFSRNWNKSRRHVTLQRRLLVETLEHRTLLSVAPNPLAGRNCYSALADLPAAAQHAVSSAIGRDQLSYSATVAKLTASDGASGNAFAAAVSVSGNTVVVGAALADHGQGAVYVFMAPSSGWANMTQVAELTASAGTVGDGFGSSVSISGNTVVVGADNATVGANGQQGAAYVFTEPVSGWTNMNQTAKLTASDGQAYNEFGGSVSIDGNTLVVGAFNATVGGKGQQGAAYLFTKPVSGWANATQVAKFTASDGAAGDSFGSSVSISGNTIVVGAWEAAIGANSEQGAAYVFTKPVTGWSNMAQTAKITASDGKAYDDFGSSISISGNTVVVGAPNATVGANSQQGAAYVFTKPVSGWAKMSQTAKLTASDGAAGDVFGMSVAISGNTIVVGADYATIGANSQQGAAYVFTEPASGWANITQTTKLTAADGQAGDFFGISVSISGNTIVVGSPELGESSGGGTTGGGDTTGGSGDTTGGSGNTTGGSGDTTGGSGDTTGGSGDTTGGSGDTTGGSGCDTGDDGGCDTGGDSGDSGDDGGGDTGGDSGDSSGDTGGDSGDSGDDATDSAVVRASNTAEVRAIHSNAVANVSAGNSQGAAYVFGIVSAPTVIGVGPSSGPATGGTTVTITGTGFTGATQVEFGTAPATNVVVNLAGTQITATSPTGTGVVDVTVMGPGGTSATSSADQFTYNPIVTAWSIVGKGDFNGDGKADVLWENTSTGQVGAWITGGGWLGLGTAPLNTGWTLTGVGDFTGDGKADVLWENRNTGLVGVWITGGGWLGLGVAPLNAGWTIAGVADFTGDGKADVLWQNLNTGLVGAWITGGGWLGLGVAPLNAGWTIAGVGDFNGDRKADVLWENQNTGLVGAWITGGGWLGLGVAPLNTGWTIAGVGDYNGDRRADVLWENQNTGLVGAWVTGGGWLGLGSFGAAPASTGWTIAGAGDFNRDGKADVLWENQNTGQVGAWITGGSWLGLGTI